MPKAITSSNNTLLKSKKVRFALVGVINTVTDFAVLNTLVSLAHTPLFMANIVSTTTAMIVSFSLNKKSVFRSEGGGIQQAVLFLIVTLAGIWLVQSTVLFAVYHAIRPIGLSDGLAVNIAKFVGISVGLVWNYVLYNFVVFKKGPSHAKNV